MIQKSTRHKYEPASELRDGPESRPGAVAPQGWKSDLRHFQKWATYNNRSSVVVSTKIHPNNAPGLYVVVGADVRLAPVTSRVSPLTHVPARLAHIDVHQAARERRLSSGKWVERLLRPRGVRCCWGAFSSRTSDVSRLTPACSHQAGESTREG